MTTTYQGHLADGSSIQKHSAGGAYPYVLVLRDSLLRPVLPHRKYVWCLIGPGIARPICLPSSEAWSAAVARILAVREQQSAWLLELDGLCSVNGHRYKPMLDAARGLFGRLGWASLSKTRRVSLLLELSAIRRTMDLPHAASTPAFVSLSEKMY